MLRKLRKSHHREVSIPLSDEEQTKIVNEIQIDSINQSILTRKAFTIVFSGIIFLVFGSHLNFFIFPWELFHWSHFELVIPKLYIHLFHIGSIFCLVVGIYIVQGQRRGPILKLSWIIIAVAYCIALVNFFLWLGLFWVQNITYAALYWMPLLNIAVLLVATYVDNDCNGLVVSAKDLEKLKYNCKTV